MVSGTLNVFQKTWMLVKDAADSIETKTEKKFTQTDEININKLNEELIKTRNDCLSLVNNCFYNYLKLIFKRIIFFDRFHTVLIILLIFPPT